MATIVFSGAAHSANAGSALDTIGTALDAQSAFQFSEAARQRFFNDTSYEVLGTPTNTELSLRFGDGDTLNVGGSELFGFPTTYTDFGYARALGGTATMSGAIGFDEAWNRVGSISQRVVDFGGATITIVSGAPEAGGTPISSIAWSKGGVTLTITGSLVAAGFDPNSAVDAFLGTHGTTLSGTVTGYTLAYSEGTVTATGLDITFDQFSASFAATDGLETLLLAGATPPSAGEIPPAGPITGTEGNDTLEGTSGDDTVQGLGGNDTIDAGAGDDSLEGGTGADLLRGGAGDDTYLVEDATDVVVEPLSQGSGGGVDTVQATLSWKLGANLENLELLGTADIDGTGNWLANRITGNDGANRLDGQGGDDTLVGGNGNDTYVLGSAGDVVQETGASDAHDAIVVHFAWSASTAMIDLTGSYGAGSVAYAGIEDVTLHGWGAFGVMGNAADNVIIGNAGDNALHGGGGNDVLIGRGGIATLFGGDGNDTYVVGAVDVIVEDVNDTGGVDTVESWLSIDLTQSRFDGVENATITGGGFRKLIGDEGANVLRGGSGANLIDGGAGSDTMEGGLGNDTYVVSDAFDVVVEQAGAGIDTVRTTLAFYELGENLENLVLLDGASTGVGNAAANRITGNASANLLDGRGGNDLMIGGGGDDTYAVDSALDRILERSGGGVDTVQSTVSFALGAHVENLELLLDARHGTGNALANQITGNEAANLLSGLAGNDVLSGGAGADTLNGGRGADTLTGGADADVFVFNAPNRAGNADLVTDFESTQDVLHLENAVFTRLGAAGALDAGLFATVSGIYTGAAPEADDRLVFNTDTGELFYDTNGSLAGGHTLIATLLNGGAAATLTAADIVVI
jgi:Ca2+-binding RTX toxin-like protein